MVDCRDSEADEACDVVGVASLLVATLKPLTGTANMVAAEVNTVVSEGLVPDAIPLNHDSVWPSESIDVHWEGKAPPLFG